MKNIDRRARTGAAAVVIGLCLLGVYVALGYVGLEAQGTPNYVYDPGWPKPLPNKWKMGGVTGLAVAPDDTIWAYNRPNDLTNIELQAELNPPIADCCVLPPSMIHFDKEGNVLGSFSAPQGHGMDVDSKGFAYLGQNTVRKYDTRSGKLVGEIAHTPENENGQKFGPQNLPNHVAGQGGQGPVVGFLPPPPGAAGRGGANAPDPAAQAAARAAFRAKYPPQTPMLVGGLEEIRVDEPANEIYVADNYLNGRILVFDLNTLAFKRGWGAYGKPLAQISTNDADHEYKPNGPMPKDFAGHLTFNFSNDGMVYMADRVANRIQVVDKQGKYQNKEFIVAPYTGVGGSTGGVSFSPDKEQRYLYISDLTNNTIWFLNRADGKVVGRYGSMGESGGQFFGLHMIATDTKGNIYTGEVFAGERVQRFVPANSARGKIIQSLARVAP